ncbi:hypothetical protein ACWEP4_22795 [Streptomyces sp. NPDC004227]
MLARFYYQAGMRVDGSVGSGFWWYFAQEAPQEPGLVRAVSSVIPRPARVGSEK